MNPSNLIPSPDTIPAPAWVFTSLEMLTFMLHILVINVIIGGTFILLYSRLFRDGDSIERSLHGPTAPKIPTAFALGINLGVAPLLFLQVVYGHLFYTSSVLMATYWILIIPLLILGYYGSYVHARNYDSRELLSKIGLSITALIVLYIGFMFVNNMTMMQVPANWTGYFENRGGTMLNLSDPTVIPRYLHFVTASVAIGGLFMALIWFIRGNKGVENAENHTKTGLRIFGIATAVQIVIGFWFLLSTPNEIMLQFLGQNLTATIILLAGILTAVGALVTAFLGKFRPTLIMLLLTVAFMVLNRFNLRAFYLDEYFQPSSLELSPQYGVMILFFIVFIVGLGIVWYMLNIATASERRAA
jgi:hypothetical protein